MFFRRLDKKANLNVFEPLIDQLTASAERMNRGNGHLPDPRF
jgi:hypothetical protein